MKVNFEQGDRNHAKGLHQGIIVFFRYNTDGTSMTYEGIYEQEVIDELTKTFYNPGDLCKVRHEEMDGPIMLVTEKVTKVYKRDDAVVTDFVGIKCR